LARGGTKAKARRHSHEERDGGRTKGWDEGRLDSGLRGNGFNQNGGAGEKTAAQGWDKPMQRERKKKKGEEKDRDEGGKRRNKEGRTMAADKQKNFGR